MSKPVKDLIAEALRARYQGVQDVCVVDLTGLDVHRTQRLRQDLVNKSIRLHVVKNSLARRAFRGGPLEPLGEQLRGPCALVTGGDSVIDVAQALVHWAKELGDIALKQAMVDGEGALLSVEEVARMKGHWELLGEIAVLVLSPSRTIAGCVAAPAARIAGCLKALAEREEAA